MKIKRTRPLTRLEVQTFIWNAQADRQDAERAKRKATRTKNATK